jgi:hypothetical protein
METGIHRNVRPGAIQYIENLDLKYLVPRLIDKLKWDEFSAQEGVRRYKKYLMLLCLHPKTALTTSLVIDETWHQHILHTRKYRHDCEQIFGEYLHHVPGTKEKEEQFRKGYERTARLYEQQFQESYAHFFPIDLALVALARCGKEVPSLW